MKITITILTKLISVYFVLLLLSTLINIENMSESMKVLYKSNMFKVALAGPFGVYAVIMTFLSMAVIPLEFLSFRNWKHAKAGLLIFHLLSVFAVSYLTFSLVILFSDNTVPSAVLIDRIWPYLLVGSVSLVIVCLLNIDRMIQNKALKKTPKIKVTLFSEALCRSRWNI